MHKKRLRNKFLLKRESPQQRLWQGLLSLACFFVITDTKGLFLLVLLWASIAHLSGKRISVLYFFTFVVSVTLVNLYPIQGKVLAQFSFVTVTDQALTNGLNKAFRLIGMIYLSLASLSPELKLPGKWGRYWVQIVGKLDFLMQNKHKIKRKDFLKSLDLFLLDLEGHASNSNQKALYVSSWASICIFFVIVATNWLIFIFFM